MIKWPARLNPDFRPNDTLRHSGQPLVWQLRCSLAPNKRLLCKEKVVVFFNTPDTPVQHFCSSFSLSYFHVFPRRMKIVSSHVTGALVVAGSCLWWPTDFILFVPFPPPGPFSIVFCQQIEAFIQSRSDTCRVCRPWFLVYIIFYAANSRSCRWSATADVTDVNMLTHARTHTLFLCLKKYKDQTE